MTLNTFHRHLALAVLIAAVATPAGAAALGKLPPPSALVGAWHMYVSVGPCNNPGAPPQQFFALNTFHQGGTLSDTNTFPTTARGPGQGVWAWQPATRQYVAHMNFMRFVDGQFDGLQDATTTIERLTHPDLLHGSIHAYMRNVDGSVRMELCGSVEGERLGVDYQP